jgi:hypothetical protein
MFFKDVGWRLKMSFHIKCLHCVGFKWSNSHVLNFLHLWGCLKISRCNLILKSYYCTYVEKELLKGWNYNFIWLNLSKFKKEKYQFFLNLYFVININVIISNWKKIDDDVV